jgi:hypothetical protein
MFSSRRRLPPFVLLFPALLLLFTMTKTNAFEGDEFSLTKHFVSASSSRREGGGENFSIKGNGDDGKPPASFEEEEHDDDDGEYEYTDYYSREERVNDDNDDYDEEGEMLFERSAHGVQLIDGKREKMMREKHRTTDKDVVERYMYTDGDKESGRKHSMIGPLLPWRFDSFGNQLTLDEIRRGIGADEEKRKEELEKSMAQRTFKIDHLQGRVKRSSNSGGGEEEEKRRIPKVSLTKVRRKTLRWTKRAMELVLRDVRKLQFPTDCDESKLLIVPLEQCPLGCRLHIYLQRALVLATSLERTLVFLPPWDSGMDHLFMPLTKCTLRTGEKNSPKREIRVKLATAIEVLGPIMFPSTSHGAPHEKINKFVETVRDAVEGYDQSEWFSFSHVERIKKVTEKIRDLIDRTVEESKESREPIVFERGNEDSHRENVVNAAMTFVMHTCPNLLFNFRDEDVNEELLKGYQDAIICHNGRCDGVDIELLGDSLPEGFDPETLNSQIPASVWRSIRSELAAGVASKANREMSESEWRSKRDEFEQRINRRGYSSAFENEGEIAEEFLIRTFNPYENLPLPGTRDDDEYSKTYDVIPYDPPFVHSHALNFELGCNDFSSACQAHFMYMSMLTSSVILRPTKETTEMLSERYFENLHQVRSPTVILQIRQSDKKGEDPYYNVFGGYRAVTRYISALKILAESTKKCWKTIFVMTDSGQVIKEVRQRYDRGEILLCGDKPILVFSKHAAEMDLDVPVFAWALRESSMNEAKGNKRSPFTRERAFVAELLLAAKIGDFVLGDGSSNIYLTLLELIASRKRVADLPQLVKATPAKFLKTYETKAYFTSQSRCENFDPASHSCFWVSSLGAAPLLGWYSVLLNQPFVNGMPVVLEYARVHRDEWLNEE